jgi:SH3 domain protein
LRAQPQKGAEVITYLRTDAKLEILGEEGSFYKVRTKEDETGFVQKSYLVEDTPKPVIIKKVIRDNEKLKARIKTLEQQYQEAISQGDDAQLKIVVELKEMRQRTSNLEKTLNETKASLKTTSSEYDALKKNAKNVVAITTERDQLRVSNEELSGKLAVIEEQKFDLQKSKTIRWFLAGAGVLFVGWILGKSSSSRRRSSLY